ncbi:hypothetical protein G7Y79_00072g097790 [Physcia stellaris]|nr:hypothetical protein G7Y79_00072g097790 [Physcia stellaris]
MNISQHGRNLLEEVVSRRNKCKTRPIIFVAHSLGGIIVKDAIVESKKYVQQPRMQQVANSCRAIFFFGTPHRGAGGAEWGIVLSNIVGTIPLGPSTYTEILRGLSPDSEKLDSLTRDFNDILNADIPVQQKIKIFSFQEGKGMTGIARFDGKVVPEGSSGIFGRRDIENSISINENHVNMCRFGSKSDSGYNIFKYNLENYLEDIQQTTAEPLDQQQAALLDRLDYEGRHIREDQLWELRADSETMQWVWNSSFPEWLSGQTGLFWICGNPATGKSTLMHHLAKSEDLQTYLKKGNDISWTIVYHFFFDFGAEKDNRNNFEGFLRSLLYQLVYKLRDKDVLRDMDRSDPSATNQQPWCVRSLREGLAILLKKHSNPICMLLDGLDEYSGDKWDLVKFLHETANAHVKLCVASRPSPEFNTTFENVPTIKMQDLNRPGIDKMVNLTIQNSMAKSGFYDDEDIVQLADEISEKANGMFLWARFAINEIRDGWTEGSDLESLRKKLDDVPAELEHIYARILSRVKSDQRHEAAHMLQLVCYAIESLPLQELYVATMLAAGRKSCSWQEITHSNIERFQKRIQALTGGVLQTFPSHYSHRYLRTWEYTTVNVIHKTVRTFLDSQGWLQLLALFPISFKELPPVNEEDHWALKEIRIHQDIPGASKYQPLLQAAAHSDNLDIIDELSPLTEYAATFMLHHAEHVEIDLDYADSIVTKCVLVFLVQNLCISYILQSPMDLNDSPDWNEIFFLEVPYVDDFFREVPYDKDQPLKDASDYFQMSLLEFAILRANFYPEYGTLEPLLVSTLLNHYSSPSDAEIIAALEKSNFDLVKFLLPYWPTGKMIFKLGTIRNGRSFETWSLPSGIAESFTGESTIGPLWYIIGCAMEEPEVKELIDIFLRRGEDINGQCCPVGTALHAVILWIDRGCWGFKWPLITTLVNRGADVNAHGPFGTPLELAWQFVSLASREEMKRLKPMALAIRELIQHGAINSKSDPNGLVPTKDSMLAFCDWMRAQVD